jgi:O-antigen/teichoic acid export membrane protein
LSASPAETEPAGSGAGYARGARILSVGIASTGLFTFAYFALASHVLPRDQYGQVSLLWAVLFVVLSVIYRPVEQLLSRSIAERRARGLTGGHPLRVPLLLQASFASGFLVLSLALKGPIQDAFDGNETLFWILVVSAMAYAASYFARGFVAGHEWFGLYGGLVLFESISRFCFPLAVAVGIASGQTAVALGIVAAPFASLAVIPFAFRRTERAAAGADRGGTLRASGAFAGSVALIQLAEQTLLNAAVLLVDGSVLAGLVFSALLIARAPLQLFQAIQTSLLPHLTGLEAGEGGADFARAIRTTLLAIAAFAGAVAAGLLLAGPPVMKLLFNDSFGRVGLALLAVGMGLHLASGTFTQALLVRGRATRAAAAWLTVAAAFVAWMVAGPIGDDLLRTEVGYAGATAVLALALGAQARRGGSR